MKLPTLPPPKVDLREQVGVLVLRSRSENNMGVRHNVTVNTTGEDINTKQFPHIVFFVSIHCSTILIICYL